MKKKRFSEEQILGYRKAADAGTPMPELYCRHGFSYASFHTWRK